ncbi:hypothetical protein H0N95_02785, partial [Candidatus Micrarchaeota archaeon]|nr:hypothetical protein [Candidatus Micrarchaeota archaeon]
LTDGLLGRIKPEKLKGIAEEQKKFSVLMLDKGKQIMLSGDEAREFFKKEGAQEELKEDVLSGRCVFTGVATGIVKVVIGVENIGKVNEGDVLVTTQATPDFISAIKKAAAVVVDEGGVTSHASVLCREFEKPAIIGVKIATKFLKDGDRVFVDATKGVVKKL